MNILNIIDLIIKAGIPAFISLISITTFIDICVVTPIVCNNIENNNREL